MFLNVSAPHLTAGQISADGAGRTGILQTDADLTMDDGVARDVETVRQSGGTFTLAGTTPATTPNAVAQTGGVRTGARNWTIGTLTIDAATWQNAQFTTTVSGTTTKQTGGTWLIRSGPHLVMNGAVAHGAAQLCVDDASNTTDPLVEVNSSWTLSGTASFGCSSNLSGAGFRINATGSLLASDAGTKNMDTPVQ